MRRGKKNTLMKYHKPKLFLNIFLKTIKFQPVEMVFNLLKCLT